MALKETDEGLAMRFFLPCRFKEGDGRERIYTEGPWGPPPGVFNPAELKIVVAENSWFMPEANRTYTIKGEDYIRDPKVIRHLMTHRGALRFDPQDAVDGGFLSYEEVTRMGYPVNPPKKAVEPVPETKAEKADPNFDTMRHEELVEYAGDQNLPVDVRKDKLGVVEDIKKAKEKRKGKR